MDYCPFCTDPYTGDREILVQGVCTLCGFVDEETFLSGYSEGEEENNGE